MTATAPPSGPGVYSNPPARTWRRPPGASAIEFHRTLPGYAPTRLVPLPQLAVELGVAQVLLKEESSRVGLPAFKILGASYAIARALAARWHLAPPVTLNDLMQAARGHHSVELVAATDGNHGRAVAHTARLLGLPSRIFVPVAITHQAKAAIRGEGADLVELDRPYDEVVAEAARTAGTMGDGGLLVQDTAWDGYEQIPQWIVDGYSTLFTETDEQCHQLGIDRVDLVAVPIGVGSLAQAAVTHYRSNESAPSLLGVEPVTAPAVITSLHEGRRVSVPTGSTIMAGLNCGTPSSTGWPDLRDGLDLATTVADEETTRAGDELRELGIDSGPCGAATLAGLRSLPAAHRPPADAVVVLISTEGRGANPLPGQ